MRHFKLVHSCAAGALLSIATLAGAAPAAEADAAAAERVGVSANSAPTSQDRIQVSTQGATLVRDGRATALQHDVTLTDGTTVTSAGHVSRADGTVLTLGAGEWLDLHGAVGNASATPVKTPAMNPAGGISAEGTDSLSQAGLQRGAAEADRRTNAAIEKAVSTAPERAAK